VTNAKAALESLYMSTVASSVEPVVCLRPQILNYCFSHDK